MPRKKKCKNKECGKLFEPSRPMQVVCSPVCGIKYTHQQKTRKEKERTKQMRKSWNLPKTTPKELAQIAFNAYIRQRDKNDPCISCGAKKAKWDAGHYRTVAAAPQLRFHPLNCHKQCSVCNQHKSGELIEYRKNLVKKIGEDKVQWLEQNNASRRYRDSDYHRIARIYRYKAKRIKNDH